jgi:hypothetical protein
MFLILFLICSSFVAQQTSSIVGTVVDRTANTVTIKTDQNVSIQLEPTDKTIYLRVPAGAQSLDQAAPIKAGEIAAGDRVLARGTKTDSGFAAWRIVVLAKADIANRRERELEEWRKRGISGIVKAVDAPAAQIQLELRGAGQSTQQGTTITINATGSAFRRYTSSSIAFEDAMQSNIAGILVGDQMRALGDKSADGKSFNADAIVSGSFRTIGATLTSIDLTKGEIVGTTLEQKKPIQIATLKESSVRRIPAALVPALAQKARANSQAEVQQLIDTLPVVALSDLKPGDIVSLTGIREKDDTRITAIKLVAGVDAVIKAMAPQPGRPQAVRLSAGLPNAFDFSVIP